MQEYVCWPGKYGGFEEMDALHRKLYAALGEIESKDDANFIAAFPDFIATVERIFSREQEWIDEENLHFREHVEQHARVLSALHHLHGGVAAGEVAVARYGVQTLLPQWLALHIATLDLPLAASLQKRLRRQQEGRSAKDRAVNVP